VSLEKIILVLKISNVDVNQIIQEIIHEEGDECKEKKQS
jgi:hypothetical protein